MLLLLNLLLARIGEAKNIIVKCKSKVIKLLRALNTGLFDYHRQARVVFNLPDQVVDITAEATS